MKKLEWNPTSDGIFNYLHIRDAVCKYSLVTMLAAKRSAGVPLELNLREYVTYTPQPSVKKAALSGFETQRWHHQSFKTGVTVAPRKDMCPPLFLENENKTVILLWY